MTDPHAPFSAYRDNNRVFERLGVLTVAKAIQYQAKIATLEAEIATLEEFLRNEEPQ